MNPIVFVMRRPVTTVLLLGALVGGSTVAVKKLRGDSFPPLNSPKVYAAFDFIGTRAKLTKDYVVRKYESYFHPQEEEVHQTLRQIVVTSPKAMDITVTQEYVCQIRSQAHIDVRAFVSGYLDKIAVREGQAVKKGDLMFQIKPILYQAKLDAENAEAELALLEWQNTKKLNADESGWAVSGL